MGAIYSLKTSRDIERLYEDVHSLQRDVSYLRTHVNERYNDLSIRLNRLLEYLELEEKHLPARTLLRKKPDVEAE